MELLAIITALAFAVIHVFDTFGYTIRLNAAKSHQLALSLSLFNTFALITRAANMFLLPSIGIIAAQLRVDPFSARLTDQTLRGETTYGDLKAFVTLMLAAKMLGTLIAQVLFTPASELLAFLYRLIIHS